MQLFIFKTLKKMPKLIWFFAIILSFSSCKDFFEEDLEDKSLTIIAPANNAISTNSNITFDWDDLEGASNYRMLIGSPSLSNPSSLYIDSNLTISALLLTLNPGDYEWKIRAENNSSETNYSPVMNLKIDSSYNLNSQTILLYTPENDYYTNSDNFNFIWQNLYAADNYNLVLKTGTNWNTGSTLLDTTITTSTINNPLTLTEGNYVWSVKGLNALPSETGFTTEWQLNIDLTSPNSGNLNLPDANTGNLNADSSYLFKWSRASNNGTVQSTLYDSIYIYSDTIQDVTYRFESLQKDSATLTLPSLSGIYYWTIITYDKAGNKSSSPFFKQFTVL